MENANFVKTVATIAGSLSVAAIIGGITAVFQINSRMAGVETQISYISRDLEYLKTTLEELRDNRYTEKDAEQLRQSLLTDITMQKIDLMNRITDNQREIMNLNRKLEESTIALRKEIKEANPPPPPN